MEKIASPVKVKELLNKYNLRAKKSFGQNFLIESAAIDQIVTAVNPQPQEQILEIGPGLGALTQALLEKDSIVTAIELDRDMVKVLQTELLPNYQNVRIISSDFLKTPWTEVGATKIVGNLPYYITTPIIMEILAKGTPWESLVFTVQWEVAEKIVAVPSSKNYAALSVAVQCMGDPEIVAKLPPHYFYPNPNVTSAVVKIKRRTPHLESLVQKKLWEVIKLSFANRRKTLQNNLRPLIKEDWVSPIDLTRRAESLNYQEFLLLTKELTEN